MKKIFLATLLIGSTGMIMAQQTPDKSADMKAKKEKREKMHEDHFNKMKTELNLTPDQEQKIKALHEQNKQEMKQNHEVMKAKMDAKREQNDAQMKQILTPEQYTKWQALKEKRKAEKKARKHARMMSPQQGAPSN